MNRRDRKSSDDDRLSGPKKASNRDGQAPDRVEESMRDLQATAGNRAVSDLVAGTGPVLQGSFFGGAFGGIEDWIAKQATEGRSSFDPGMKEDPGMKQDPGTAAMKQESSDGTVWADASDKWDGSEKSDASDKWDGSQKFDASDKWDGSEKSDASEKWDGSEKSDASDKWDGSEKIDASDKWDASEKSEGDMASKDEQLDQELSEKW